MLRKSHLLLFVLILTLFAVPVLAQNALTETYVSPDERLTLRYPEGWVVVDEDDGIVVLATDESLGGGIDEALPPGEREKEQHVAGRAGGDERLLGIDRISARHRRLHGRWRG